MKLTKTQLRQIIKEELEAALEEASAVGKQLPPAWIEAGLKPNPDCDRKVPDGAKMREYKKCLENPAAYQPSKSKKRTLDDITAKEDHPFYSKE